MNSFNSVLLSTFARNERFNNQIESLRRRLQTLSLIYSNWAVIFLIATFIPIMKLILNHQDPYVLGTLCFPLLLANFVVIHYKKLDAAAIVLVFILHTSNKIVSDLLNCPLISIVGNLIYPYISLFITSSRKVLVLNFILCCATFLYNSVKAYEIFQVTINDEQARQINFLIGICFFLITSISIISIFQKSMEVQIWSLAQENYHRSERLNQEVIKAMETKDTFISTVSHEIRNPLNSLKGSVDYLAQVIKNRDHLMVLRNARLSGEVLLNLVNNVLDAAKLKTDKMDIACMDTNFEEVLKKVLTINSESFKDKSLSVEAFIDDALPQRIWVDPCRLLQILMNLISNAIKFTPSEGKIKVYASWCSAPQTKQTLLAPIIFESKPSLTTRNRQNSENENKSLVETEEMNSSEQVSFIKKLKSVARYQIGPAPHDETSFFGPQTSNDPWKIESIPFNRYFHSPKLDTSYYPETSHHQTYLKIQVIDTGCGISTEESSKLFGMFEQAAQGSRSVHGGSGLGLWICKQLCQKMNGDITVYSETGKGSSFVFYIPIDNTQIINDAHFLRQHTSRKNVRALIVDDFATNRYVHRLLLEQQEVRVTVASGGQEAVDIYTKQENDPFDLILMDVNMPEVDGFMAAKLIKEWEENTGKTPAELYFVTGEYFDEDNVLKEFKKTGGSPQGVKWLKKPLDSEALRQIVINLK